MPCYSPIDAWRAASVNESGKRGVAFALRNGRVDEPLELPCGKCHGCRADQALMWSIRAYHESTQHLRNSFVTLTYDDDNLPPDGKIHKKDLQDFFKRARRDGTKLRYIACGEYGERTHRPHYHAIIFGQDWLDSKIPLTDKLYTNQRLIDTWGKGNVSIAPVTMASICYTCGYVTKKIDDPDTFSLMSRRPGIGHTWLNKHFEDLQRTGVVVIEGREYPVPKRYLDWKEDEFEELKQQRKRRAEERNFLEHRASLHHREINKKSLLDQKKETL